MIQYLTGATGTYLETGIAADHNIGLMIQPGNGYYRRLAHYSAWGADNGAFSRTRVFDPAAFRRMLHRPELAASSSTCLFVAAPDVLFDAAATLQALPYWSDAIRSVGLPVALVAQDGLEVLLPRLNWSLFDVLFVGGTTAWKLGNQARSCVLHALRRDKRVHFGRVNSYKRLATANALGAHSADGTFLAFGPRTNVPRLLHWLKRLNE